MTIKIFYFLIALFTIGIFFALFDTEFGADFLTNTKIQTIKAIKVDSYEIDFNGVEAVYQANEVIRYKDYDEIFKFNAHYKDENLHELSSDTAIIKDKIITMKQNVIYKNIDDNLTYNSDELIYTDKILTSPQEFTIKQNSDVILGKNGVYDTKNKHLSAQDIKGNFIK